jgi:hypothetical protein
VKLQEVMAVAFTMGITGSVLFFSCGREEDSSTSGSSETMTSAGKDVTQAFQLEVTGATLDAASGTFGAGTRAALSTAGSPTEFTSNPAVTPVSGAVIAQATDANGSPLQKAKLPFALTLTKSADAGENLCVLGLGADHVLRRWKLDALASNTETAVSFKTIWLGTYQALQCGSNFDAVAVVAAAGDALAGDAASNACNYVEVEDYGYCMTYHGSNFVQSVASIAELQQTCEEQKGVFGKACVTDKVVGTCAFGYETKQEVAWTWYESSVEQKPLAEIEADCVKAQGKWFEVGAYAPTPADKQK